VDGDSVRDAGGASVRISSIKRGGSMIHRGPRFMRGRGTGRGRRGGVRGISGRVVGEVGPPGVRARFEQQRGRQVLRRSSEMDEEEEDEEQNYSDSDKGWWITFLPLSFVIYRF